MRDECSLQTVTFMDERKDRAMEKKYMCNPLNVEYKYQFTQDPQNGGVKVAREAADPSMIVFEGRYYIFASMTLGVWVSDDMANWEYHRLLDELPLYDYAPDVRVIGEWVYFCASKRMEICNYYRTKDVLNGPYEKIEGTFDFWDPNLFVDDDGKIYFYWGCDNRTPIYGVELDPKTMKPLTERKELIFGNPFEHGYERIGDDNSELPLSETELETQFQKMLSDMGEQKDNLPQEMFPLVKASISRNPYMEGAWMDKHDGKYYLQYACPGAEYNVYADGVYTADSPLGPFTLAVNNPFSYKPGGFIPGAGHGSTMEDRHGNLWHASTMSISINHPFERRIGFWPAGFDSDGELFCNQRYGDWPFVLEENQMEPWKNPDWYLLSYQKKMTCSSYIEGKNPELAADENVHTWWQAASEEEGQWICMDLGGSCDVRAVQINFADDKIEVPIPGEMKGAQYQQRYIEERQWRTRWILEGSSDGKNYFVIEDKSGAEENLPHDLIVKEEGLKIRYIKLTILEVPYHQKPCISGLRVFGIGNGEVPKAPLFLAERISDIDMVVTIQNNDAVGYNILWGHTPEKLYHNYMIFGKNTQRIGACVKGEKYYVRVDSFNEAGITEGTVQEVHAGIR